jgi:photosystem II stability/assembly factor-like uncharacterized protein
LGRIILVLHRTNRTRAAGVVFAWALTVLGISLRPSAPGASAAASRSAGTIVDTVEGFRLERLVRALSGADSIFTGAERTRIATRSALVPDRDILRSYLIDEIRSAGYEPVLQRFMLNVTVPDLTGSALSSAGDTLWVADTDGKVYRSTAGSGETAFARCGSLGHDIYDLERDPTGRLWASVRLSGSALGALFVSADGGASWSEKASGSGIYTLGSVAFSGAQFGMAGGSNGTLIRTADAGESWSPLDPAVFGYESINDVAATGLLHYWLVTDFGSVYETDDFGTVWDKRSLVFGTLRGIDFADESHGVIVGGGRAFYTKNAGATWTSVSVATEFTAVRMGDSLRVLAAGTGGELWASENGGASWTRLTAASCPSADVWSIASPDGSSFSLTGRDLVRNVVWDSGPAVESCGAVQFADTVWGKNISFRREGERYPDRRFLLTAHYDSRSPTPFECAPGADDNASGVAGVLECARILRGARLERSVEFVLFDGEELGLLGSRYYAGRLDTAIVYEGDLNLDMIGWEQHEAMSMALAERSGATPDTILVNALAAAIDSFDIPLGMEFILPGEPGSSDHVAFWDVGIPAVMMIEGRSGDRTPYYHTCGDAANTLNYGFLEACAKAALGAISILAGVVPDAPPAFALRQNFPNPFNAGTVLSYSLSAPADVELAVYDVSGRRVALIERSSRGAGDYERPWNGRDEGGRRLASGVYFLRLKAGAAESVRKIVIIR